MWFAQYSSARYWPRSADPQSPTFQLRASLRAAGIRAVRPHAYSYLAGREGRRPRLEILHQMRWPVKTMLGERQITGLQGILAHPCHCHELRASRAGRRYPHQIASRTF
eukprot:1194916-Prorocentrum_minimum.AAC.1